MNYFGGHSEIYHESLQDAYRVLNPHLKDDIHLVVQTGSGFDFLANLPFNHVTSIPYSHIPHFPKPTVMGHSGTLHIFLTSDNKKIVVLGGRIHAYEGYDAWELAFPIRVLAKAKPKLVLLTNAVGGISPKMHPGDLVMITHHVNHFGINPMADLDEKKFGVRFIPLNNLYDQTIYKLFEEAVEKEKLKTNLHRGTYFGSLGPTFETEKEIDAAETLHGDVVGMSTVVEAITARACGLKVSALSLVSNHACGRGPSDFTHEEVLGVAKAAKDKILKLMIYGIEHYEDRHL